MGRAKYIWMAVTADEYEMPLAVADTAKELGEIFGISGKTVMTMEFRQLEGKGMGRKFVKVDREE